MKPSGKRTAVLLDQYPLWLEAVEPVLTKIGIGVIGKATTAERALALIDQGRPDVLVVEPRLPSGSPNGPGLIREARRRLPTLKVIVLGSSAAQDDIDGAFAAGAVAYVFKTAHPDDIASAIRQAFGHSVFYANGRQRPGSQNGPASQNGQVADPTPDEPPSGLTRRELEILQLAAEGLSNSQLASRLWVTEQTIKFHLSNVYRKLGVSNRTEASRWAQVNDVLPASPPRPTA
jgi:DNA-binding NarL/FixJ family response regulator